MPHKDKDKRKEYHKQYNKQHYKDNKNKILENQKQYKTEHKQEIKEQSKQYRKINEDEIKEKHQKYYEEHKDEILKKNRERYKEHKDEILEKTNKYKKEHKNEIKQYYKEHRDEILEQGRKYREEHPEKALNAHIRRQALVGDQEITKQDWVEIMGSTNWKCIYCSTDLTHKNRTVDHIIPLIKGGLHRKDNLVPACKFCNFSKGPKLLNVWNYPNKMFLMFAVLNHTHTII